MVEPMTFRWGRTQAQTVLHAVTVHRTHHHGVCGKPVMVDPLIGIADITEVAQRWGPVCGQCALNITRREIHRARHAQQDARVPILTTEPTDRRASA